jgi:hypothetical protein
MMRDGLVNFNLEEESTSHLRELLLQCVIHVPYIKNDDVSSSLNQDH